MQARHHIALARRRLEHLHVGTFKARGAQPRRHGVGGVPGIAGLGDGIDLHKLLVDVEGELLLRRQRLGTRRRHADEAQWGGEEGGRSGRKRGIQHRGAARPRSETAGGEGMDHGYLAFFVKSIRGLHEAAPVLAGVCVILAEPPTPAGARRLT